MIVLIAHAMQIAGPDLRIFVGRQEIRSRGGRRRAAHLIGSSRRLQFPRCCFKLVGVAGGRHVYARGGEDTLAPRGVPLEYPLRRAVIPDRIRRKTALGVLIGQQRRDLGVGISL